MKNTKLKYKTIKGKVIWKIDFYRVLKRSYSIFIRKAMFGGGCIDARIRAHYLPLTLSNYIDEVYCFSIAPLSEFSVDELIEPIAIILDSNGIGDKATNAPNQIVECAKDATGNRLIRADVGIRRFFMTLSPALKGRLVGEDRIEDDEVRIHFNTNAIGDPLK